MTAGGIEFWEELDMIGAVKSGSWHCCQHISLDNFNDFWVFRKSRGAGSSQVKRFVQKWSYSKIFLIELIKFIRNILWILIILPTIYKSYKFSKYSNQPKVKEFLLFCYTIPLEKIAMSIGAFECLGDIIQKEKKSKTMKIRDPKKDMSSNIIIDKEIDIHSSNFIKKGIRRFIYPIFNFVNNLIISIRFLSKKIPC